MHDGKLILFCFHKGLLAQVVKSSSYLAAEILCSNPPSLNITCINFFYMFFIVNLYPYLIIVKHVFDAS